MADLRRNIVGNIEAFQYSVGDAYLSTSELPQQCSSMSFQYSIGDAEHTAILPHIQTQSSFNTPLEMQEALRGEVHRREGDSLSILHWRCPLPRGPTSTSAPTPLPFNTPLEMRRPHLLRPRRRFGRFQYSVGDACSTQRRGSCCSMHTTSFNTPLEMQTYALLSKFIPLRRDMLSILRWRCSKLR